MDCPLPASDSVAWAAGGVLRKQLGGTGPVLRAAWCFFQNTGPEPVLCLLHHGALSVHTHGGDVHHIPLPGAFTALWPLPQGVLLTVRSGGSHTGRGRTPGACGGAAAGEGQPQAAFLLTEAALVMLKRIPLFLGGLLTQGAPEQGPCILVHPLENIQEVQMAGPGSTGAAGTAGGSATPGVAGGGGAVGGGWGEGEQVVWSGVEVPYLVTHNVVGSGGPRL